MREPASGILHFNSTVSLQQTVHETFVVISSIKQLQLTRTCVETKIDIVYTLIVPLSVFSFPHIIMLTPYLVYNLFVVVPRVENAVSEGCGSTATDLHTPEHNASIDQLIATTLEI